MNPAKNKQIAVNWFEAFNTKNLQNLLMLYHENARHYSPKLKIARPNTNGLIQGKKALESWWSDAFERLPDLQYEPLKIIADEQYVFMEYLRKVSGEEDLIVGELLEIDNGSIIFSKVYHG